MFATPVRVVLRAWLVERADQSPRGIGTARPDLRFARSAMLDQRSELIVEGAFHGGRRPHGRKAALDALEPYGVDSRLQENRKPIGVASRLLEAGASRTTVKTLTS